MKPYIKNRLWLVAIAIILIFIYKTDFSEQIDRIYTVLSPVIISLLFAWFLVPAKNKIEDFLKANFKGFLKKHSSGISAALVYIFFLALIVFFIVCLIPVLKTGISNSVQQFENYQHILKKYISEDTINRILEKINPEIYITGAKNTISVIFNIGMSFIVLIYILLEHGQLKKLSVEVLTFAIGDDKTEKLIYYLSEINLIFIKYFYSKFISSMMLGIIVTVGFFTAGISYPIFFGVIVALFNMLPVFGAFISSVPIALLTFAEYGAVKAIISIAIIIAGQQIENNILTPKIVGDTVGLSGFWIIFTIIAGGGLFGFWGLLICVPVSATFKMLFEEFKQRKTI